MGRKLTKKQRTLLKQKHRKKKIKRLESLDAKGISRKKFKFVIKTKTFITMKIIGIISIPIVYFIYSPLLVIVMIYFIVLFFFAIGTEHGLNKSVIKSNHISIPKYDSAIALVLVCISFFGTIFSTSRERIGMFTNTLSMKLTEFFNNFGSLLTGVRSIFNSTKNFGLMDRPEGFIPDRQAMMDQFGDMPRPEGRFNGFEGRPMQIELNMDDIPIEFMFSQLLSTIATVLIVAAGIFAIVSLYVTIKKINKFNKDQNELIIDNKIILLEDDKIFEILDFGEIEKE